MTCSTNLTKSSFNCGGATKGNLTVASGGLMNWTGGDAVGSLIISSNGVLDFGGAIFLDAAVTNYGTINWTNGDVHKYFFTGRSDPKPIA